jgi:dinuclear metal center YbgI/SA1388 family protein
MVPYSLDDRRASASVAGASFTTIALIRTPDKPELLMATADCRDIIGFVDDLLDPAAYDDYGPNGLQVPGKREIQTIATGVSANAELFERARAKSADLVLVHHGLFWAGPPRALDLASKRRLQLLFEADLALAAYHLPLDGHLELGNNALLAAALGAQDVEPFGAHKAATIGVRARFARGGISPAELVGRTAAATDREPLAFTDGPDPVRTIGIVSGAGADYLDDAIAEGLDAFVTGEPAERSMSRAREAGVHFLAAGHYATETFGVRAVGERLVERFGVRHVFVDVPNPI